ncbi:MAG: septal ring lytic transglycosylase RlpA family protein [Flavobacterium sp.]|jgi:rare lipoprotein A|uniref:septal ring lytic transglycosylase RlpA family protein n=1 Tax=Flavobacterium sp. TaxID=239 RepID=UPI003BA537C9
MKHKWIVGILGILFLGLLSVFSLKNKSFRGSFFSFTTVNDTLKKDTTVVDTIQKEGNLKFTLLKKGAHASYYADKFNGRRTASGERFDNQKYTAAHRTLPFGTKVRVTNEANGKSTIVKINDRGPFTKGRHIDLTKRAFRDIARHHGYGSMKVTIELVEEIKDSE